MFHRAIIQSIVSTVPSAPPDPVRRAFARIEAWKVICLTVCFWGMSLPWLQPHGAAWHGEMSRHLKLPGWAVLRQQGGFILPLLALKLLLLHTLLWAWNRHRRTAPLSSACAYGSWLASTTADIVVIGLLGSALYGVVSCCGTPLDWDGFYERYNVERHLTPAALLVALAGLGLAALSLAVGPYVLYRAMQSRARSVVLGAVPGDQGGAVPESRWLTPRMALLGGALLTFLALPWTSTRHFTAWRGESPVPDRSPGYLFLLGTGGHGQREGAGLLSIALLALIGLAWASRPRVLGRGWPARLSLLVAEAVCLLAWGVGYALLAFPPLEWLGSGRWQRVTEVAPFLNAQLLAICLLETLWFGIRQRSTDTTDEHG